MSVRRVKRAERVRWEVRWREQTQHRSRSFDRRADALAWEAEIRRRRQLGPLALTQLTASAPTLGEWIAARWAPEHGATLEQSTRDRYANVYTCHIAHTLDGVPLTEITVAALRSWQAGLIEAGVGPGTIQKARTLLSSVLRHAAESEAIPGNPLALVRAPSSEHRDAVRPLAPATVEAIRKALLSPPARAVAASRPGQRGRRSYELPPPGTPQTRRRDALMVSLLAYSGMRPGELRALRLQDVREKTLLLERAARPDGSIKATKNHQRRAVRLLAPLAHDLREYRRGVERQSATGLLLGEDGKPWSKSDWNVWSRDRWAPACRACGLHPVPRPYDLRHGFASLLLAEGRQPLYVAGQLGHSLAVLLSTYAHLIAEYEDADRIDAEREIERARRDGCTSEVRRRPLPEGAHRGSSR